MPATWRPGSAHSVYRPTGPRVDKVATAPLRSYLTRNPNLLIYRLSQFARSPSSSLIWGLVLRCGSGRVAAQRRHPDSGSNLVAPGTVPSSASAAARPAPRADGKNRLNTEPDKLYIAPAVGLWRKRPFSRLLPMRKIKVTVARRSRPR
jgi:hypothetical protein